MSSSTAWNKNASTNIEVPFHSLPDLQSILIPGCYINLLSSDMKRKITFSMLRREKQVQLNIYHHDVSFIHGKAKTDHSQSHTIPRLELCAAVLGTRLKDTIMQHLSIPIVFIALHTDSRVVLGYMNTDVFMFMSETEET